MKLRLIFLIVVLSLAACGSKKQVVTTDTTTEKRKEVREVFRDTILKAAPQSSNLQINVSELCADYKAQKQNYLASADNEPVSNSYEPKQYKSQDGDAYVDAQLMQNLLTIRGGCDTIALTAQIKDRLEKQFENNNSRYNKKTKRGVSTFRMIYTSVIIGIIGVGIGFVSAKLSN